MLCAKSNRILGFAALALFSALFAFGGVNAARAQEPPTTIPAGGPLPFDPNAIPFNSWLLYPSVNFLAENSNNYFITPQSKLSGWAFGVDPSLTAEWSNGIHTTTLYGNFQQLQYPPDNQVPQESNIAAPSGEATWTQQYAPLRDLNFTVVGDYVHQTLSPGLTSSIPNPTQFTGTTVLPNGNIVLPNGTIITPTGQVVGQAGSIPSVGPTAFVNPYDQYTGTARVQKIFNGGIVTLGTSLQQVDYEHAQQSSPNYINKTFTEDASFWLGPVFYAYTDGSFNIRTTGPKWRLHGLPHCRWRRDPPVRAVSYLRLLWIPGIGSVNARHQRRRCLRSNPGVLSDSAMDYQCQCRRNHKPRAGECGAVNASHRYPWDHAAANSTHWRDENHLDQFTFELHH